MYYSFVQKTFTNYTGTPRIETLNLSFGEHEDLSISFDRDIGDLKWTLIATHNGVTILYTSHEDIRIVERRALYIPINTYTQEFKTATEKGSISATIELYAVDASDHIQHVINLPLLAHPSSVSGATPPEIVIPPSGNFVTPEQLEEYAAQTGDAIQKIQKNIENLILCEVPGENPTIHFTGGNAYYHELIDCETIRFDFSAIDDRFVTTIELWLKMPETVVSFGLPDVDEWLDDPKFDEKNKIFCVVIRRSRFSTIASLAYYHSVTLRNTP